MDRFVFNVYIMFLGSLKCFCNCFIIFLTHHSSFIIHQWSSFIMHHFPQNTYIIRQQKQINPSRYVPCWRVQGWQRLSKPSWPPAHVWFLLPPSNDAPLEASMTWAFQHPDEGTWKKNATWVVIMWDMMMIKMNRTIKVRNKYKSKKAGYESVYE